MTFRLIMVLGFVLFSGCSSKKNKSNDSISDKISETVATDSEKKEEELPTVKSEKYTNWIINIGNEKLRVESLGWCFGTDECDFEDYVKVTYRDRYIFLKRKFLSSMTLNEFETEGDKHIKIYRSWEVSPDQLNVLKSEFENKKNKLSNATLRLKLEETFDTKYYKNLIATEHYLQTERCANSEFINYFKNICPLENGNINFVNESMDIFSSISSAYTGIEYDIVSDSIVSVATYLPRLFDNLFNFRGTNFIVIQHSFGFVPNKNIISYNAVNPKLASSLSRYNHMCAMMYQKKVSPDGFSKDYINVYRIKKNPAWDDELSQEMNKEYLSRGKEWIYYDNSETEPLFHLEKFEDRFPAFETLSDFLSEGLYKGKACETYVQN
jgi:hypothetical protein